jgi:hypothetical protein
MTAESSAQSLDELARLLGVTRSYHDGTGTFRHASDEALLTIVRALGAPLEHIDDAPEALRAMCERAASPELTHVVETGRASAVRIHVHAGSPTDVRLVLESSVDNSGECNPIEPTPATLGCNRDGVQAPLDDREGPDPINPIIVPEQQLQSPVNKGVFESHYIMFMLGASTWF